jgi:hypothetical protein
MKLPALCAGKPDMLISLTEKLLKGLSNRDYQNFDEKYIKVRYEALPDVLKIEK